MQDLKVNELKALQSIRNSCLHESVCYLKR